MSAPRPEDMRAGFTGLLVAAVVLVIALLTIVHVTNNYYAGEGAHAEAAK